MAQTFYPITPTEIVPGGINDWEPMDASALIASGATGVIVHVVSTDFASNYALGLRKNGSTDSRTNVLVGGTHCWAAIGVDASRIFEAYVGHTTSIDIYVVGYTMSGVTFKTNADDMSLGVTGSWESIDCSAETDPSAVGLIFEVQSSSDFVYMSLRKNGSSDEHTRKTIWHNCFGVIIGCDGSQIVEGIIGNVSIDFFLVGYITDGCTFNTNGTDVSLGATGSWLDLAALPVGANMGFIEVPSSSTYEYGLRKNDSAENIYEEVYNHCWAFVECDAGRIIEGKIANIGADFFVVGYSEEAAVGIQDKSANMGAKMIAGKLI